MAFDAVLARCIDAWRGEGLPLAPPRREAEIHEAWGRFGHRASEDIIQLYTTIGGFAELFDDDRFFWSLWPWDFLIEENRRWPGAGVRFCDHSIHVFDWELRYEDERQSSVWQLTDGWETAPTLEAFFETYLDDPYRLIGPSARWLDRHEPPGQSPLAPQ